jgi:hypothetical protein
MRDAIIIFVAIILSIAIGGYLYLNGGPTFNDVPSTDVGTFSRSSFDVLAEGQDSGGVDRRTNFRIVSDEEFNELWSMLYTSGGPAIPSVDFSKNEVIAVFDGSHSSGGYSVEVTDVSDADGVRTVDITRHEPTDDCVVASSITSPFVIIRVSKSALPLAKEETLVAGCGS